MSCLSKDVLYADNETENFTYDSEIENFTYRSQDS